MTGTTTTELRRGPRPQQRRPLFRHPGRLAIVVVAALAAANLLVVVLATSDTSAPGRNGLPDTVDSVSPQAGSITSLRETISVDLRDDLYGVILLDRQEVPEDQLDRIEELGLVSFRPGPGRSLEQLPAGTREVIVLFWPRTEPRPRNPGSYSWTFRATA